MILPEQVTLFIMRRAVRWCIPNPSCDTIQVWFDADDPNLWRADDTNYTTYLLGSEGLKMLADNGIFPRGVNDGLGENTLDVSNSPYYGDCNDLRRAYRGRQ